MNNNFCIGLTLGSLPNFHGFAYNGVNQTKMTLDGHFSMLQEKKMTT